MSGTHTDRLTAPASPTAPLDHYHALLTDDALGAASQETLVDMLRRDNLFFGDRPLCGVLRPRFLTMDQYKHIAYGCKLVAQAFEKLRVAAMQRPDLRAQFGLHAWEEQIIHDDPGFAIASPTSRLDAFYAPGEGGLKFTEFNAETPAGGAYNDALSRAMMALPVMHEFARTHVVQPIPAAPGIIHALLTAFYSWRGVRETPQVCILDWAEVPTRSEFVLFEKEFAARGIPVFIGDPRDAEYRDGTLYVAGQKVTLIYKRVLIDELVERCGLDSAVVRAVRERAVCMVNPFRCKVLHKKASLAVVSDEANEGLLNADEQRAVAAHVPWTRVVTERKTRYGKDEVDLIAFTAANRERLVLKPNDEYGGKGIVLGWTVDDSAWNDAIKVALSAPHIVQERVTVPHEIWPAWQGRSVHFGERMLDTAPFLFDGTVMAGCLTRIATDPLLNVTAGGGSNVPTFIVEER
jgi:uncharacterized circularly permuted ATP-grasp superfamily protein